MRNRFNTKQLFEAAKKEGRPDRFFEDLREALETKQVRPTDFGVGDLFEDFVEDGRSIVDQWRNNPDARMTLTEAGVNTTAFLNISGQLLVTSVMEVYDDPMWISDKLVKTVPTNLPRGEKIPGMSRIGNEAEAIGEGKPYPYVGFGEDWIETPEAIKRGMIVGLTREMIATNNTGLAIDRAQDVAYWIRYNKEIRCLQVALGITSTYNRRGRGVIATYGDNSGAHDFDNLAASNTLVDWTDIEAAELLFDDLVDPNTGEPINIIPRQIVIPSALKHTTKRVVNATTLRFGDGASSTTQTEGANTVDDYEIVTSQLVKKVTSSASTWFMGDFKKGFQYREVSPVQVVKAPANSHDEFHLDILQQWKVSEWGAAACTEPRCAVKCT